MKISVLGTGAYGIALANLLTRNSNQVIMWTKFKEELDMLTVKRENENVLKGIKLNEEVEITDNIENCIKDTEVIVIAVPTDAIDSVTKEVSQYITKNQIICITSKGITSNGKISAEVVKLNIQNANIVVLSGPSFAIDMANENPLGLTIASDNIKSCNKVKRLFENGSVEIQISNDILGVLLLGAIKNVYAIAMGIVEALNISDSTKAKLLTKYLSDLGEIIIKLGASKDTLYTYAGIGDFLLTTMSVKSRNFSFGKLIGEGNNPKEAFELLGVKTVEGFFTTKYIYELLNSKNIQIESIQKIYEVLYNNKEAKYIIK